MTRRDWIAILVCTALAVLCYLLSVSAALTKSPTYDEPLHFLAGYTHAFEKDYRVDVEDPPLALRLAMLPIRAGELNLAPTRDGYELLLVRYGIAESWVKNTICRAPENAAVSIELINRSRRAMGLLAAAVVALACWIGWKLAGRASAIAVGVLLAFDPLLLGHGSLVKNDVAIMLLMLGVCGALCAFLKRITMWRAAAVIVCCGIVVIVKFSGIAIVGLVILALIVQAIHMRSRRSFVLVGIAAAIVFGAMFAIWAAYGCRFSATADGRSLDRAGFIDAVAHRAVFAKLNREPTTQEARDWSPDPVTHAVLWIDDHHLLPDAYCMGFLYTRGAAMVRMNYLLTKVHTSGHWYYFPAAMLFKSPVASIAAVLIGAVIALAKIRRGVPTELRSPLLVFAIVGGGYFVTAMTSDLNIGVRHVLPVYPMVYLFAAIVFARLLASRRRIAMTLGTILGIALAIESLLAWPNYLAFFNVAAGGSRGGLWLLSDSNLDWGQDLPLLAEWQSRHPSEPVALMYFGTIDPELYGIRYGRLRDGTGAAPEMTLDRPCVIAISTTHLQGVYTKFRPRELIITEPREVLGGSIYLYDYPIDPRRPKVK